MCRVDHQGLHKDEQQVKKIVVVDLGKSGCLEYVYGEEGKEVETTTTVEGSYEWDNVDISRLKHRGMVGPLVSSSVYSASSSNSSSSSSFSFSIKQQQQKKKIISGRIILIFCEYSESLLLSQSATSMVIQNRLFANSLLSQVVQKEFQ